MLDSGADVNALDANKCTALMRGCKKGDDLAIQWLLEKKIDINAQDKNGNTALHYIVFRGTQKSFLLLLQYDASVNIKNNSGMTALYEALTNVHNGMAQIFLIKGQRFAFLIIEV